MGKQTMKNMWMIGGLAALMVGCSPLSQESVPKKDPNAQVVQAAQIPGDLTYQDVLQKGEQIHFVFVSPKDSRVFLGTRAGLYASASGGLWSLFSPELANSDITGVVFDPNNPKWLYLGGNRISKCSLDGGKTWKEAKAGLPKSLDIRCVTGARIGQEMNLFVYVENEGVYFSQDGGQHWKKHPAVNGEVFAIDYDTANQRLYLLTQDGLMYEENGQWNQEAIPDVEQTYSFSIDRDHNRIYLATDKGVMVKQDDKWEMLGQQLPEQAILLASGSGQNQVTAVGESASLYIWQNKAWKKWE